MKLKVLALTCEGLQLREQHLRYVHQSLGQFSLGFQRDEL